MQPLKHLAWSLSSTCNGHISLSFPLPTNLYLESKADQATRLIGCQNAYRASKRICNHERRRREVVGTRQRMDTPLEIAVAGEDSGHNEIYT
jgi:hypothetical protein